MTNEEAIKQLEITKECDVDTVAQIKALDVAIAALRNHSVDTDKMVPLTLEQVRMRRGTWVWIVSPDTKSMFLHIGSTSGTRLSVVWSITCVIMEHGLPMITLLVRLLHVFTASGL